MRKAINKVGKMFKKEGISEKNIKLRCQNSGEDGIFGPCQIILLKGDGEEVDLGVGRWDKAGENHWKRVRGDENTFFRENDLDTINKVEKIVKKQLP